MARGPPTNGKWQRESLSRQRTKDSSQMAKGKLRRARQAMSRSSGKETSVTANGKGKPVGRRQTSFGHGTASMLLRRCEGSGGYTACDGKAKLLRARETLRRSTARERFRPRQGKLAAVSDPSGPAVTRHVTARPGQVCGFNVAVHGCDDERQPAIAVFLYPLMARGRLLPANHSTS